MPEHKLLSGSVYSYSSTGHITAAVSEVASATTIVVGVYGNSDKSDEAYSMYWKNYHNFCGYYLKSIIRHNAFFWLEISMLLWRKKVQTRYNNKPLTPELPHEILDS
jgi:hypothetical protein